MTSIHCDPNSPALSTKRHSISWDPSTLSYQPLNNPSARLDIAYSRAEAFLLVLPVPASPCCFTTAIASQTPADRGGESSQFKCLEADHGCHSALASTNLSVIKTFATQTTPKADHRILGPPYPQPQTSSRLVGPATGRINTFMHRISINTAKNTWRRRHWPSECPRNDPIIPT